MDKLRTGPGRARLRRSHHIREAAVELGGAEGPGRLRRAPCERPHLCRARGRVREGGSVMGIPCTRRSVHISTGCGGGGAYPHIPALAVYARGILQLLANPCQKGVLRPYQDPIFSRGEIGLYQREEGI
jgi:hypothetical protein